MLLLAFTLAACGTSDQTVTTTTEEAMTSGAAEAEDEATATTTSMTELPVAERVLYSIEQFNTNANYMGIQSGWFGKLVKDKFNIEINIIAPNEAGSGETLYQTRTAAGNLGDSIIVSKSRAIELQEMGLVMEMSPLIANAPNIQKLNMAYESFAAMFPDGGVYGIPGRVSAQSATTPVGRGVNPEVAPYLQYEWYLDIGAPEIESWDHLLEVLDQMVKANPISDTGVKTFAISSFPGWDGNSVRAAHEMLYMNGYNYGSGYIWMNATDKTTEILTEPDGLYYQNLKWLNKAFMMGILDPDSATHSWESISAKVHVDHCIAFAMWPFLADSVFAGIDLNERMPYAPIPVKGMLLNSPAYNPYGMDNIVYAIGAGAEYPDRIMELYDWLASPEGILAVNNHVEGVTYEMVDAKPVLTAFGLDNNPDKQTPSELGGGTWIDGTCKLNSPLTHQDDPNELLGGESANPALWASTIAANANEYSRKWAEAYGANNPIQYFMDNGYMIVTPSTDYAEPIEPSEIRALRAQIREIVQPAGWRMIYAATDELFQSIWDEALAELADSEIETLLEWDQKIVDAKFEAIDRVMGAN